MTYDFMVSFFSGDSTSYQIIGINFLHMSLPKFAIRFNDLKTLSRYGLTTPIHFK